MVTEQNAGAGICSLFTVSSWEERISEVLLPTPGSVKKGSQNGASRGTYGGTFPVGTLQLSRRNPSSTSRISIPPRFQILIDLPVSIFRYRSCLYSLRPNRQLLKKSVTIVGWTFAACLTPSSESSDVTPRTVFKSAVFSCPPRALPSSLDGTLLPHPPPPAFGCFFSPVMSVRSLTLFTPLLLYLARVFLFDRFKRMSFPLLLTLPRSLVSFLSDDFYAPRCPPTSDCSALTVVF